MKLLNLALLLAIVGCGSDGKFGGGGGKDDAEDEEEQSDESGAPGAENAPRSMLVADEESLPACAEEAEGWIVYVASTKVLKACQGGEWADVASFEPTRIVASIYCGGTLDDADIAINYFVSVMNTGDVFASAEINAGVKQASGTRFYSAQQEGAKTASVLVTDDQLGDANAGFWTVSLDRETLITTVLYQDADGDDMSWSQSADTCVANAY